MFRALAHVPVPWSVDGVVAGMVLAVAYGVVVALSWARARVWPKQLSEPVEAEERQPAEAQLA